MPKRRLLLVQYSIAFVAAAAVCATGASNQGDLRSRFLEEYPSAAAKLADAASKICLVERQTTVYPDKEVEIQVEYRANGTSVMFRETEATAEGVKESVVVATPTRSFGIRKSPGATEFTLRSLTDARDYDRRCEVIRVTTYLPFAPHCFLEIPIEQMLRDPEFKVSEVVEVEFDGKKAIQASWQFPMRPPGGEVSDRRGLFVFAPDDCWALLAWQYWFGDTPPARHYARVRYGERVAGVPVATEYDRWSEKDGKRFNDLRVRAVETQLQPAKLSEFSLRSFGLPDLDQPATTNRSRVAYWLIGLAIFAGIVAFLVRRSMRASGQ